MTVRTAFAPAKINLFLHVGPPDARGYHPLASLVAFADVGDRLTARPAEQAALSVAGPFAAGLSAGPDNLVLRALAAYGDLTGEGPPPLALELDKRLPLAAGLGGGSSDAGAALRLARDLLRPDLGDDRLESAAARLGADGPMCLHARAAWAEGFGERLTFEPRLPPLPALLVNPGVASPTADVYRACDAEPRPPVDRPAPPPVWDAASVIDWLAGQRNDLEGPAVRLQPAIGEALAEIRALPEVRLARMSGSGATVFALFGSAAEAARAAAVLAGRRPAWWIAPATLA